MELEAYVGMIKRVLDRDYGKEVVFYNDKKWYSRYHSRYISLQELEDYLLEVTSKDEYYE